MPLRENSWDHVNWLRHFRYAHKERSGFKNLRIEVFEHTMAMVYLGAYRVDGEEVSIPKSDGSQSVFYEKTPRADEVKTQEKPTTLFTINADCIETARLISLLGYEPLVLNMANQDNPGGSVWEGSGAQEENIFRRSNLHTSLYQFVEYGIRYGVARNEDHNYPIPSPSGGIYSPGITVFKGGEHNGYCLLKKPFQLSFVTVPAIAFPELIEEEGTFKMAAHLVEPSKEKIRSIVRIGLAHQHDALVLSAFGCGAFRTPPKHMASLFREVFEEDEFKNKFKAIVFAIIDDHNAWKVHNPEGNILPFLKTFE